MAQTQTGTVKATGPGKLKQSADSIRRFLEIFNQDFHFGLPRFHKVYIGPIDQSGRLMVFNFSPHHRFILVNSRQWAQPAASSLCRRNNNLLFGDAIEYRHPHSQMLIHQQVRRVRHPFRQRNVLVFAALKYLEKH